MYAFGRTKDEIRAQLETLRKRVEEGLKDKLPQEVPVPAPPTKSTRGNKASWHNKPNYYSDPKISEEEFERRKNLPNGLQHHIVTTRTKPNKEVEVLETPTIITTPLFVDLDVKSTSPSPNKKSIPDLKDSTSDFVESELGAQLFAASRPAVAPTPDAVHVSQTLLSSPPDPVQQLADLLSEEQRDTDRIALIDLTIQDLHSERKALTDKVLSLKDQRCNLLLSMMMPDHPFARVSASRSSEATSAITKTPAATESAQPMEESSPIQPIPHAASTELLYLMHQSEEKGVQIALTDAEVVSSFLSSHKRVHSVEENLPNKKMDYKASPDKLEKGSTNVAVFQPMHSNSTISSVISQSVESSCPNDQTKEISTGKAQTVYEPTVPQPKVAELKVAERVVHAKVVQSKAADPKIVQTKKSTAANDTKSTQKPTDGNSRSLENCRTSSRREESSTQKATSKPSKVNAQPFEAASKLPAPATDANPAKDTAAATASTAACEIVSNHPILLPAHLTAVKCVYIHGPCVFTASEDGTVHIYDLKTNLLVKEISANTHPVSWLYATSLKTSSEESTTEYLNHVTLITGNEDAHIRQFKLPNGSLKDEKFCSCFLTCVAGHVTLAELYVGTTVGVITYDPRDNMIKRINKFQVNDVVICMKIGCIRGKKVIIVAAKQMDPIVFDLESENTLFTLASDIPKLWNCFSSSSKYVFCCDDEKLFIFDAKKGLLNDTQTLPSAAVGSFLIRKQFLVLRCMDGVIYVLDTRHKPPYHIFTLPGQGLKTITCMDVVGDKIVCGSTNGELVHFQLPNLEALNKASRK